MNNSSQKQFASFKEFYPFYLSEHSNDTNRRLHFVGTSGVIVLMGMVLLSQRWGLLWAIPALGYFAWAGHFVFEKNRPATFQHPIYSLICDFVMWRDILVRRLPW